MCALYSMYTMDMECTYAQMGSNEQYQAELLKVFQIDNVNELGNKISDLYHHVKDHSTLESLLNKIIEIYIWVNREQAFYLLFSYDYFYMTHEYIKEVLTEKKVTHYDFLYSKFK